MDYTIKIGGEAGQGVQTVGDTLAKVFSRAGYHVFTQQDYESRIRGGHNFFQIRFSDRPLAASGAKIDIVVALDRETIMRNEREMAEGGLILYDQSALKEKHESPGFLDIPFVSLAGGYGEIMANTVATGAVLGILKIGLDILAGILEATFGKKGKEIVQANIDAARAGHDFAVKQCAQCSFETIPFSNPKMLVTGTEAIALGAIAAGCKFYAAYPMTPSTGIMNYLASKEEEYGIVVEQAEDEIAAINMALGASFAGVRAMTGTAGGGFALMVEGLSLAGMTETPVVIALGQRPAPATGLPTRTEQGDLLFAIHAAHGEFPRAVFAPGTPEQAFHLTNKAFDIAEKYQIPAFVIFDQYLGDTACTYDTFDLSAGRFEDYRLRGEEFGRLESYRRHAFTESGVSPLGVPGDSFHLVATDSDEHDEGGHITEDAETRIKMMQKRLFRKSPLIRGEIAPPVLYGSDRPETVIVGWGSTYGVLKEVVDALPRERKVALMHFTEIYPFPGTVEFDYLKVLREAKRAVCVENNATGQFLRLMRMETGFEFPYRINRFDGRPFTVGGVLKEIENIL